MGSFNPMSQRPKLRPVVSAKVFRAKELSECIYCPHSIKPGQPVTQDYEARSWVHAGCFQRINARIALANKEDK